MDNRVVSNPAQDFQLQFWRAMLQVNTCIPAVIDEFDPDTQLCKCTPAINWRFVTQDGTVEHRSMPQIINVPLAVSKSLDGMSVTIPLKEGNPCTLFFSQRALDNYLDGVSNPVEGEDPSTSTPRCFDVTDALCFPGVITTDPIPNYSTEAVEVRNQDGSVKVSVTPADINIVSSGTCNIQTTGNTTVTSQADLVVQTTGDVDVSAGGNINAQVQGNMEAIVGGNCDTQVIGNQTVQAAGYISLTSAAQIEMTAPSVIVNAPNAAFAGVVQIPVLQLGSPPLAIGGGTPAFDIQTTGNVISGAINLATHTHGGVQNGTGNTGVPQ
jgi:hypothetical protein